MVLSPELCTFSLGLLKLLLQRPFDETYEITTIMAPETLPYQTENYDLINFHVNCFLYSLQFGNYKILI